MRMDNEREKMLKRLQAADFALYEAVLYLDTHPNDQVALDYYDKYQKIQKEAEADFTERFGALQSNDVKTGDYFGWVGNPWPWEMEE